MSEHLKTRDSALVEKLSWRNALQTPNRTHKKYGTNANVNAEETLRTLE